MIKFEEVEVSGWKAAIRGMRNAHESWDMSDTEYKSILDSKCSEDAKKAKMCNGILVCIGKNDLKLMQSLIKAGSDHAKFMRMIHVQLDITAPRYWWTECDTYKVGTVRNSCSTIHKLHSKELTLDDFSCEHLTAYSEKALLNEIEVINSYRENFISKDAKDYDKKLFRYQMKALLPENYNQKATFDTNYEVIRRMYHSRNKHPLDEWSVDFCKFIETELPYAKELICI